jgi:transcriptional regulator GlxA family with amidase domain
VGYDGEGMTAQRKLVRRIDRYLIAAGSRPVFIAEICETFKVRRRSLYRAFNDVMGIPPITYLRRKRLDDVRTALLTVDPGAMVCDIALAHGFHELGRFAAVYRRQFGELPSQTLRRAHTGRRAR